MTIMVQMKMMCIGLEKQKLRYEWPVVTDVDPSVFLNGQELRVIGEYVDPATFGEWDAYAESVAGAMFTDWEW